MEDAAKMLRAYLSDKEINNREYARVAVLVPDLEIAVSQIERLRWENEEMRRTFGSHPLFHEKDAEIAQLRARIKKLDPLAAPVWPDGKTESAGASAVEYPGGEPAGQNKGDEPGTRSLGAQARDGQSEASDEAPR